MGRILGSLDYVSFLLSSLGQYSTSLVSAYVRLRYHIRLFSFLKPAFVDFSIMNSALVHYSQIHKFHFSVTFSLKMSHMVLFTYLKIILL